MSALLSAADLADLAAAGGDAMGDLARLSRPTTTPDGSGGSTDVYALVAATVPIQMVRPSATELESLAGQENEAAVQVMGRVPLGTDVKVRDRLTLASNGHRFQVVTVWEPPTFAAAVRILLVVAP